MGYEEVRVEIPVLVNGGGGSIDRSTGRGLRRLCLEGLVGLLPPNNPSHDSSSDDASTNKDHQNNNKQRRRKVGMIVSHPYGPVGGNMYNHVVKSFCNYGHNILKLDVTLRYNNRGIGYSEGRGSWRGDVEYLDLLGCCEFLHVHYGIIDFLLIGYSYGSIFSSSLTVKDLNDYLYRYHYSLIPTKIVEGQQDQEQQQQQQQYCNIIGYTTIAYPFGVHWALTLFNKSFLQKTRSITGIPRLFLFGDKDDFTSLNGIEKMINSLVDDSLTNVYILGKRKGDGRAGAGYDHFFANKEKLAKLIKCFEYWLNQNNLLVYFFENRMKKEEDDEEEEEEMTIINLSGEQQHSSASLKMKIQHNQMTILYIT